jgi:thymidylate kinase
MKLQKSVEFYIDEFFKPAPTLLEVLDNFKAQVMDAYAKAISGKNAEVIAIDFNKYGYDNSSPDRVVVFYLVEETEQEKASREKKEAQEKLKKEKLEQKERERYEQLKLKFEKKDV